MQQPVRFDIALHFQGFEKNYYTTVFPVENLKRFNIPANSQFLLDTAAVLLTGPAMLPKVIDFHQETIQMPSQPTLKKQGESVMMKQSLRIIDMGPGLSYRIRLCTFNKESWTPTREVIFTTPICPLDIK
jgi:hypothetical protein